MDAEPDEDQRLLLIVEDDEAFARTLTRSFERRGYRVLNAASLPEVEALLAEHTPGFAVVDLKLKGEASGLACVQRLHAADAEMLIVVLTGFASIAKEPGEEGGIAWWAHIGGFVAGAILIKIMSFRRQSSSQTLDYTDN